MKVVEQQAIGIGIRNGKNVFEVELQKVAVVPLFAEMMFSPLLPRL